MGFMDFISNLVKSPVQKKEEQFNQFLNSGECHSCGEIDPTRICISCQEIFCLNCDGSKGLDCCPSCGRGSKFLLNYWQYVHFFDARELLYNQITRFSIPLDDDNESMRAFGVDLNTTHVQAALENRLIDRQTKSLVVERHNKAMTMFREVHEESYLKYYIESGLINDRKALMQDILEKSAKWEAEHEDDYIYDFSPFKNSKKVLKDLTAREGSDKLESDVHSYSSRPSIVDDPKLDSAIKAIMETKIASASGLQRCLNISYPRAVRLISGLEQLGILEPQPSESSIPRDILVDEKRALELLNWGTILYDPMLKDAIMLINTGKLSASFLQRYLNIGYPRGARLISGLEQLGILGPQLSNSSKPRDILLDEKRALELLERARKGFCREPATEKLLSAVGNANVEEITRLIQEGADVNAFDKGEMTPLMRAAMRNKNPDVLRVLIDNGADVNDIGKYAVDGWTPLMFAAMRNENPDVLRLLIENGAGVNVADEDGRTPLMYAAECNNPDVLQILMDNGADVAVEDRRGRKALAHADLKVFKGTDAYNSLKQKTVESLKNATEKLLYMTNSASVEEITPLIIEGADVNAVDKDEMTPLMLAAKNNENPDILRILIENGAIINAVDENGMTPLMIAAENNKNPDILQVLVENGADVNVVDEKGMTPLMLAASSNENPDVLRILIENGANVNAVDENGKTPLMIATENNINPGILQVLVENGADVNVVDEKGMTPLMLAASSNENSDVLRILIENGANVNAVDENGKTTLMLAATENENHVVLRFLIENGADVNAVDENKKTPLMFAVECNKNPDVLRALIENGADVNAVDEDGYTLLRHFFRSSLNPDVLRLLIENGADVNSVVDYSDNTPLMRAAEQEKNPDVLLLLIENGADINAIDKNGRTPLMLAVLYNNNPDVVQTLIENGADVAIKDKEGKRVLYYAEQNGIFKRSDAYNLLMEKTLSQK